MQKLIETLKEFGIEIPSEKQAEVKKALSEHYKNAAEHAKALSKLETERDSYKTQLDAANETLEKFKDMDPDKVADEIAGYKKAAEDAKAEAQKAIQQRDQRDFLKGEFDKLGIASERTRKSLMSEIMGEDGLKWKDGAFMGLSDFLKAENEKDHFYKTEEEKELEKKQQQAAGKSPKFTEPSQGKQKELIDDKPAPTIF